MLRKIFGIWSDIAQAWLGLLRKMLAEFCTFKECLFIIIMLTTSLLWVVRLIAMQFTDGVNWTPFDFIVAGVLLLGTGLMCELVIRKVAKLRLRVAICVALLAMLLLIWIELAVGIFGTPVSGQ